MRRIVRAIAILVLLSPVLALAAAPPDRPEERLSRRAQQAVDALTGKVTPASIFTPEFLAAVPATQLAELAETLQAQHGEIMDATGLEAESRNSARFTIPFERASATAHMTLEPNEPFRIAGLLISAVIPADDGPAKLRADFASLPGRSGFLLARLGEEGVEAVIADNAQQQFAIGSTFKLWVLDALAEEVRAGRRRWDEVVPLGPRSLPSGLTQDWPEGAPVTVATLAALMISISDNTATDTLIHLIGRERIEARLKAIGHSDPARALPFLTTAESFALKLSPEGIRRAYAAANEAQRRRQIAALGTKSLLGGADLSKLDGKPVGIEVIEWFAAPEDVARVLDSLRRHEDPRVLEILGIAGNLPDTMAGRFTYAGYKGGSETGVLNLSWLLRDHRGQWFVATGSWNDPQARLDNSRFELLMQRLIASGAAASGAGSAINANRSEGS